MKVSQPVDSPVEKQELSSELGTVLGTVLSTVLSTVVIDARFLGSGSGLDTYARCLLPEVAKLLPKARFILLANPAIKREIAWLPHQQFEIYPLLAKPYSLSEQWALWRAPKGDLFWSCNYNIPFFATSPLLVTIHDAMYESFYATMMPWYKQQIVKLYRKRIKAIAAGIFCVSGFVHNEFIWRHGQPAGKIKVTRLGVDASWFQGQPKQARAKERLHERPFFLAAGNIRKHKNLVNLIHAFGKVREKIEHDLLIIGSAEGRFGIDQTALKLMQSERGVYYKGIASNAKSQQFFAECDALVFPSLYEGFGLPPLEAMACQKPVVASYSTAIPEVCGQAVLYFDPLDINDISDKMLQIVRDSDLRKKLIRAGSLRARSFTWERCAKETCELMLAVWHDKVRGKAGRARE